MHQRQFSLPLAVAAACALALSGLPAGAQDAPPPRSWTVEKCARYRDAWKEALARFGRAGLSADFLERHDAFLASGCLKDADVCPRSKQELALANVMVVRAMNAGTASTFLPFACRK